MLQIWEVLLQLPEGQRLHQSFGSVLHGALMQYAHTDFAEAMHRSALRPFSQFVYYDKARGSAVWQLAALNKEAAEEIKIEDNDGHCDQSDHDGIAHTVDQQRT